MASVLGVKISGVNFDEALKAVEESVVKNKKCHIVTVNPEFIIEAQKDEEFRRVLNNADLALPDGVGILWASRLLGKPIQERVAGTDLVIELAEMSAKCGWKIFLLGGGEGVAEKAKKALQGRFSGLQMDTFAGARNVRSEKPSELELAARKINAFSPDLLFVAYGSPWQDLWIARNRDQLKFKVAMGVGGALDFISGKRKRAPQVMRALGLEWLWRLILEPRRLPRIFRAVVVFPALFLKRVLLKKEALAAQESGIS